MNKKVLVIGLEPEYNYPGDVRLWGQNNTKYASNHGASLISRTLIKMFDADYASDIENPDKYLGKYELCIIAFATHATDWRDVTLYADFIEKLNIPTALFSLGIQDYAPESGHVNRLHSSLIRILNHVTRTTKYIGVRGFHTAGLLYKEGYNNVIPIGCPTLYNGMKRNLLIEKHSKFSTPINVFHRTIAELSSKLTDNITLLGQDFLDEVIFTENFPNDVLKAEEIKNFQKLKNGNSTLENIKKNGVFFKTFDEWFGKIGSSDFVFGPRLHGCISGLIQGIPSLMLARDIRVNEIADFFKIPKVSYKKYQEESLEELYDKIDFTAFNQLYPKRYDNFTSFLTNAGIIKYYKGEVNSSEISFSFDDLQENQLAIYMSIGNLQKRLNAIEANINKPVTQNEKKKFKKLRKLYSFVKKINQK